MPGVSIMPFGQESSYDVLHAGTVLIERSAVEKMEAETPDVDEAAAEPGSTADEENDDA